MEEVHVTCVASGWTEVRALKNKAHVESELSSPWRLRRGSRGRPPPRAEPLRGNLAQLDFLAEAKNVIFLGPPGTGKTHLSITLGVQAARRGHRVTFATAHEWVLRLAEAKRVGRLEAELDRLGRIPLLIVDEVGYIPFDPEAGALFFALVSQYERRSMTVSSNKTFSGWAEIFGDPVAVAAMVDRFVHHAEVIVLKGESYRLKGKGKEVMGSGDGA